MTDDFDFVATGPDEPNKLRVGYLICKHCKQRVETGVINVSSHWMNCLKRTDGLIIARNELERAVLDSWSIKPIENGNNKNFHRH